MKYVEPVLFPINFDLLEAFKLIGSSNMKNVDILGNYNYQEIHHNIVMNYIHSDLLDYCYEYLLLYNYTDLADVVDKFNISMYRGYFLYFLVSYVREAGKFEGVEEFKGWLSQDRDYTFKKLTKPKYIGSITSYYNTIIIPKLWRSRSLGNVLNRMVGLNVNYFDQEATITKAYEHLIEGGKLYLYNKRDYSIVLNAIGRDYDEVEPYVFQKRITPKVKTKTTLKLWL